MQRDSTQAFIACSGSALFAAGLAVVAAVYITVSLSPLHAAIPQARPVVPAVDVKFDVASVKSNKSGDTVSSIEMPLGGRLNASNVSLLALLLVAFSLQDSQVIGGPTWFARDRFDVRATANAPLSPEQLRQMLRALLVDRFRLRAHVESRPTDVYALVLARDANSLGSGLRQSVEDCDTPAPSGTLRPECSTQMTAGLIASRGATMDALSVNLSRWAGRQVVNRTGLPGRFDVSLRWTQSSTAAAAATAKWPSLFGAVHEQLGLKLDARREPIDLLVVESAEPPTED